MSTIAGFIICFLAEGRVRLLTIAVADDVEAERRIIERFGKIDVLSRAPVDAKTLALLRLKVGEWVEWVPVDHRL
jgi:hypothetical protein